MRKAPGGLGRTLGSGGPFASELRQAALSLYLLAPRWLAWWLVLALLLGGSNLGPSAPPLRGGLALVTNAVDLAALSVLSNAW